MSLNTPISIHPLLSLAFPPLKTKDTKDEINTDAAWHYYSHCIRRNSKDLNAHTRRIFLAMQHNDGKFLVGSLTDLFITLKDAGIKLRIRLLKASAPYLEKQQIVYFASWLKSDSNSDKDYSHVWAPGSMLSKGLIEPDKALFSKKQSIGLDNRLSAIEEARACMEYGQLDVAKKILEDAIEQDAGNQVLKDELSNLRQYLDDDLDQKNLPAGN